jgi:hypothetical protein
VFTCFKFEVQLPANSGNKQHADLRVRWCVISLFRDLPALYDVFSLVLVIVRDGELAFD